ncbi:MULTISPECIES: SpaH/EbpB family LPXTG-anchored major pilin [unclassified Microbacterium]|uniref:SpaH/EbpB family LPXTG-anchored major pilin n=1 Tax=unclassified Microbacterium TaxID=2609290 RepID=UPI003015A046
MTNNTGPLRRVAMAAGVFALALAGLSGLGGAANAAGFPVVPDQPGTLTVHKYAGDPTGQPNDGSAQSVNLPALQGVEFTIWQLGTSNGATCSPVDLMTPAGWADVTTASAAFDSATGDVPAGFCEISTAGTTQATDENGATAFSGLKGLYLVKETGSGGNLIKTPAAPFLVTVPFPVQSSDGQTASWNFDVHVYPKNTLNQFVPQKTVAGSNEDGVVVPGAVVPWTITVPVPQSPLAYQSLVITDNPAAGMTFTAWDAISVNGTALAAGDYTVSGATVTLTASGLDKVNELATAGAVTVTAALTTTVDGSAVGLIKNEADVTLNGTTTPVNPPTTNWGTLRVLKQDASAKTTLAGAAFAVYEAVGADCTQLPTTAVATGETGADGTFSQALWISNTNAGIEPGTKNYCLVETQAPNGYVLDSAPRLVTISANGTAVTEYTFPNTKVQGPQLPLTGADGTVWFTVGGLALIVIAAGALLTLRRRAQR